MPERRRILFLCTGNTCRSQMAEGWARALAPDRLQAFSAGLEARDLDPRAVTVMAEARVDIRGQRSKTVERLLAELAGPGFDPAGFADAGFDDAGFDHPVFDDVVTVCDHARETCPVLPGGGRSTHAGFDDPPRLAADADSEEDALSHYRRVRDEIRALVERLAAAASASETAPSDTARSETEPADTAPHDAVSTDTAPHDAVSTDTVPHDAVSTDTAPHDAAPADTATHDAVPTDTATHDAVPTDRRTPGEPREDTRTTIRGRRPRGARP